MHLSACSLRRVSTWIVLCSPFPIAHTLGSSPSCLLAAGILFHKNLALKVIQLSHKYWPKEWENHWRLAVMKLFFASWPTLWALPLQGKLQVAPCREGQAHCHLPSDRENNHQIFCLQNTQKEERVFHHCLFVLITWQSSSCCSSLAIISLKSSPGPATISIIDVWKRLYMIL